MSRYRIEKVIPGACKEDIMAILHRNLDYEMGTPIFGWKYENSLNGSAECWLARREPLGSAVGSAALFPRIFHVEGQPRMVGITGDFCVDLEHRGFGPALLLQRRLLSDVIETGGYSWLYGVPNDKSQAIFTRLGYRTVGRFQKYVKILKVDYILRKRSIFQNLFFKQIGAGIIALSRERFYRRAKGVSTDAPGCFDARFDSLWAAVKHQYPVIGERNAAFLTWRYSVSSCKAYKIFTLVMDGNMAGYVIYLVRDGLCQVVDLLCSRERKIAECLIAEFSLRMREEGIEAISIRYFGSSFLDVCLRRYNFIRHGTNNEPLMFYEMEIGEIRRSLEDEKKLYFLDGDRDI